MHECHIALCDHNLCELVGWGAAEGAASVVHNQRNLASLPLDSLPVPVQAYHALPVYSAIRGDVCQESCLEACRNLVRNLHYLGPQ